MGQQQVDADGDDRAGHDEHQPCAVHDGVHCEDSGKPEGRGAIERRVIVGGDFIVSSIPNAGTPFRVQRYVLEWAETMEAMAALSPTLHPGIGGLHYWQHSWVNGFADMATEPELRLSLWLLAMDAAIILLMLLIVRKNWEVLAWYTVALFAAAMMFSISQPLWHLIESVSRVATPWRMAALIMFSMIYLIVRVRPRRAFMLALAALFCITGSQLVQSAKDANPDARALLIAAQPVFTYFNTRWTEEYYADRSKPDFLRDFVLNAPREKASLPSGVAEIEQWDHRGIVINTQSKHVGKLRIEHLYFPAWQATVDGAAAEITPEENSLGRMLVELPQGSHEVRLRFDIFAALPTSYRVICGLSLASFLFLGALWVRQRFVIARRRSRRGNPSLYPLTCKKDGSPRYARDDDNIRRGYRAATARSCLPPE